MISIQNENFLTYLKLEAKILYYLRKNFGRNKIICGKKLAEKFNKTKGRISPILTSWEEKGIISMEYLPFRTKHGCQKRIKLTKEGYWYVTNMIFEAMNEKERELVRHLVKVLNVKLD